MLLYVLRLLISGILVLRPLPSMRPPPGFVPPSLGVGLPTDGSTTRKNRGLQEERVECDSWKNILAALTRIKEVRDQESQALETSNEAKMEE